MKFTGVLTFAFAATVAAAPAPQGGLGGLGGLFNFTRPTTGPIIPIPPVPIPSVVVSVPSVAIPTAEPPTLPIPPSLNGTASVGTGNPIFGSGSGFKFRRNAKNGARTEVAYQAKNGLPIFNGTVH